MKRLKIVLLSLIIATSFFAQEEKDSVVIYYDKVQVRPQFGVFYQKNAFVNIGVSIHKYDVHYERRGNYSLFTMGQAGMSISADILVRFDKTILSPKLSFDAMAIGATCGSALGLDFNYYTDQANSFIGITPRIGLPLNNLSLYYGYTFFVSKNYFDRHIGHHKIGIYFILNREYRAKCLEMYKDYQDYQSQFR